MEIKYMIGLICEQWAPGLKGNKKSEMDKKQVEMVKNKVKQR